MPVDALPGALIALANLALCQASSAVSSCSGSFDFLDCPDIHLIARYRMW